MSLTGTLGGGGVASGSSLLTGGGPALVSWLNQPGPAVSVPTVTPAVESVVTGIDPNELANATYGKPIPISALGKARIGTAGIIFGPYIESGRATFAVSFGAPADPAGIRAIYEIAFDSKVAWEDAAGFSGAGTPATGFISESFTFRFKQGRLDQAVDALETEKFGAEAIAYRPQIVLYIEDLPLAQFGNKLPFVAAVIGDITGGADPDDGITLGEAIERMALSPWAGFTSSDFETSGVEDLIGGMIVAENNSLLDLLQDINRIYRNIDILQTDKLKVVDRGPLTTPDITLNLDRVLNEDVPISFDIQAPEDVPRELEFETIDPDQDYIFVPSKAQRPAVPVATSASHGKDTISLPIILDAPNRQAMTAYAKYAEEQARKRVSFTAMAYGLEIEPGDRVKLEDIADGISDEIFRIIETTHGANFVVECVGESILNCALPAEGSAESVQCYAEGFTATNTFTLSAADLGVANADRRVVVGINLTMAAVGQTITGVTIRGVAATEAAVASNTGQGLISAIWYAHVPEGATGDVVVTASGNFTEISVHVYRLVSAVFAVADTDSDEATTGSAVPVDVDIPAGGYAIAAAATRTGASFTWAGANANCTFANTVDTTGQKSAASYFAADAETAFAISVDPSSIDRVTIAVASFTI